MTLELVADANSDSGLAFKVSGTPANSGNYTIEGFNFLDVSEGLEPFGVDPLLFTLDLTVDGGSGSELPSTGVNGSLWAVVSGVLMALGTGLVLRRKVRA
ncbi:MAG: LPXTG cell wall anchor domain-containing protein [Microbacteriaceae bacterium]